ncbi:MAG: cobalamin biosynthesis protein CobD [bacterium]|nr:MAG: cobalamin biosynthesis protein CobD [bacterium]
MPVGLSIIAAFALDLIFGDPKNSLHPVRWMGVFIEWLENRCRRFFKNELTGGAVLLTVITAAVYFAGFLAASTACAVHPAAGFLAHVLMIYFSISTKSLGDAAMSVHDPLAEGDIEGARKKLSGLVGRDTVNMDNPQVTRAAVESVAENSVDGIISPLFFAALGGGPLALAYRAVNTCDSMIGYRNERYEKFGKASARADDAVNFIPARLSIALIYFSAFLLNMDYGNSVKMAIRDRLKHPSPNAGHPEAAFAGALGIQLGGAGFYQSVSSEKPFIGEPKQEPEARHIADAVRLMRVTALIACVLFALPCLYFSRAF